MEKDNTKQLIESMNTAGYSKMDILYVQNAYSIACYLHKQKSQKSHSEQLKNQCLHLIYTTLILVKLRLDANTIAAALMHDILYTTDTDPKYLKQTFPETVIQYLKDMKEFHNMTMQYLQGNLTQSIQDLLESPINSHVILICAAKRIDRLNEFAHVREDERPYYLDNTNELLKRLVEKEGSIYLSDQLSECWLRCKAFYKETDTEPNDYKKYEEKYKMLLGGNKTSAGETIALLKDAFAGKAKDMPVDMIKHTKHIKELLCSERLISNILKHIKKDEHHGSAQPFSKWSVPLYDITLIFYDSAGSTHFLIDEFIYIFQYYLRKHYFTIRNYLITTDQVPYFVISDRWENRFRIFLRTEYLFRRYQIGDIANEEYKSQLLSDPLMNKGSVHIILENGYDYFLPAGYSGLDYAFMIDEYNWMNFQEMTINNTVIDTIGNIKLNKGDIGKLSFGDHATADISWFKYIETVQPRERLVEYFKSNYLMITK